MPRRFTLSTLSIVILLLSIQALAIQPNIVNVPKGVKQLSEKVSKFGTGHGALIAVRMNDKTAVSGYVSEVGKESMIVVDTKTGEETKISFYKVDKLQGYNIETGKEVHENTGLRGKLGRLALKGWPGHEIPQNGFTHSTALVVGIIIGILLAIILAKVV